MNERSDPVPYSMMPDTRTRLALDDLSNWKGKTVGVSSWMPVTQDMISTFADLTGDRQWIHVDTEKSRAHSPYGSTVAHGFLTLALIPAMIDDVVILSDAGLAVNVGLNRVRFPAALPAGLRVRGHVSMLEAEPIQEAVQIVWQVAVECEGGEKPVCVAELLTRCYRDKP